MPSKGNRNSGKNNKYTSSELPPGATSYPEAQWKRDYAIATKDYALTTVLLSGEVACTANGSGVIATVIDDNPSVYSPAWTSLAAAFDGYRVLGFRVTFKPLWGTGGATITYWSIISSVIDRDDSAALASYANAMSYATHKEAAGQQSFSQLSCAQSSEDLTFLSTGSPAARGWVKLYSSGNSASITVGRLMVEYMVQFRQLGL